MVRYLLTEDVPGREMLGCGIAAIQDGMTVDKIADVSTDRDFVSALAETLTREDVSILHFHDIVEDAVAEK